jgi:DNA repair exonuclease SbcCD ATPase subunit
MKASVSIVLILALAATSFFFYSRNRDMERQLVELRREMEGVSELRTEVETLRTQAARAPELEQLQKEAAEVHKLRNQVRQFQKEKETLARQVQSVEASKADLQQRIEVQQTQLQAAHAQPVQQGVVPVVAMSLADQRNTCIANLKQWDGATEQWALENRKKAGDTPTLEELVGAKAYIRRMPVCPGGGTYTLAPVGQMPTCTIPGHELPR